MSDATYYKSLHDTNRILSIAIYALYLLALPLGITAIVGVIMAYVCRDDAVGTPFASHFENAIQIFWVFFGVMLVAVPLCFLVIGIPMVIALYIWVLYKVIRGLIRVVDDRPYYP